MAKLRGGTAGLEVETGRWRGVSSEERVCKNCQSGEVEDVEHLLMRCSSVADEREKLVRLMREKVEWQNLEDSGRVTAVLSYACRSSGIGRILEKIWQKWFVTSVSLPILPPPPHVDPKLTHQIIVTRMTSHLQFIACIFFQCCMGLLYTLVCSCTRCT